MGKKQTKTSLIKLENSLFIDTETVNNDRICMEVSFFILNGNFIPIEKHCYIIKEVWYNHAFRNGEYSQDKLDIWAQMLENGTAQLIGIDYLYNKLNQIIRHHDIKVMIAYNAMFDYQSVLTTFERYKHLIRLYSDNSKYSQLDYLCIWEYAKVIYCTKEYIKWALENNFITPTGKVSTSAECVYRYLINDKYFIESHIGIEDLDIELKIFNTSIIKNATKRNNKVVLNKNGNWQTVERSRKLLEDKGKV